MMKLVAGQEEALQRLMDRHADCLYSQLANVLKNRGDAYDSLQEAFLRVYRFRERFDFHRKFSSWLNAIAFNLARDQLRSRARRPESVSLDDPGEGHELAEKLFDPESPPDEQLQNEEESRALLGAVGALPEGLQKPLVLFALEEKSQAEIAAELRSTAKAVEMRLYRARKQLHVLLENGRDEREGFSVSRRNNSQWITKTEL
jgi:RNA polymerase sigma-70 factor (ECF subfamily)